MNSRFRALTMMLAGLLAVGAARLAPAQDQESSDMSKDSGIELIIRTDDIGFCHSINMAIEKVLEEGRVTAISVMACGPWLDHAVDILKRHPEVSVGVHLALNSEWREYKWGPVASVSEVSSLVDENGKFFGTRKDLMANLPKPEEVEKELRAQLDLALRKGLDISYVDYHMGAAMGTLEFQEIVEKLAAEYGIGVSRYFGEIGLSGVYNADPDKKVEKAVELIEGISEPGRYLLVVHPGWDTPEMAAMTDLNETGLPYMSKHRHAEAHMLCDPRFLEAIEKKGIRLVGYDDLRKSELPKMTRPFVAKPYEEILRDEGIYNPYTDGPNPGM